MARAAGARARRDGARTEPATAARSQTARRGAPVSGVGRYLALRGARHAQRWGLTLFILRLIVLYCIAATTVAL